jgi:DNA-binding transcriptional ArsR family regulator
MIQKTQQRIYEKRAHLLQLFANKQRLAIIGTLKEYQEASVGFIAKEIELSLHATSKHLQLLEHMHIIRSRQEGTFRMYRLAVSKNNIVRYMVQYVA